MQRDRRSRFLRRLAGPVVLVVTVAACSTTDRAADDAPARTTPPTQAGTTVPTATPVESPAAPQLDFVHRADGGALTVANNRGTLRLDGAAPTVVAFTDRPGRVASPAPIGEALDMLGLGPDALDPTSPVPPNATLVIEGGPAVTLELLAFRWDPAPRRLDLDVVVLTDDEGPAAFDREGRRVALPATFAAASLFIDSAEFDESFYSFELDIVNRTTDTFTLVAPDPDRGDWDRGRSPADVATIAPGATANLALLTRGWFSGVDGQVDLKVAERPGFGVWIHVARHVLLDPAIDPTAVGYRLEHRWEPVPDDDWKRHPHAVVEVLPLTPS